MFIEAPEALPEVLSPDIDLREAVLAEALRGLMVPAVALL
jgi:hypothetical protein